jgi:hypothetical protein
MVRLWRMLDYWDVGLQGSAVVRLPCQCSLLSRDHKQANRAQWLHSNRDVCLFLYTVCGCQYDHSLCKPIDDTFISFLTYVRTYCRYVGSGILLWRNPLQTKLRGERIFKDFSLQKFKRDGVVLLISSQSVNVFLVIFPFLCTGRGRGSPL